METVETLRCEGSGADAVRAIRAASRVFVKTCWGEMPVAKDALVRHVRIMCGMGGVRFGWTLSSNGHLVAEWKYLERENIRIRVWAVLANRNPPVREGGYNVDECECVEPSAEG